MTDHDPLAELLRPLAQAPDDTTRQTHLAAIVDAHHDTPAPVRRPRTMLSSLLSAAATKVAAATTVATASLGGVAVAGELPPSLQDTVSDVAFEVGLDLPSAADGELDDALAALADTDVPDDDVAEEDDAIGTDDGEEDGTTDDGEDDGEEDVTTDDGEDDGPGAAIAAISQQMAAQIAEARDECRTAVAEADSKDAARQAREDCRTQTRELTAQAQQARQDIIDGHVADRIADRDHTEDGTDDRREADEDTREQWHTDRTELVERIRNGGDAADAAREELAERARQHGQDTADANRPDHAADKNADKNADEDTDEPAATQETDEHDGHTGPPSDAGPPEDSGAPEHAGPPADAGRPGH